MSTAAIEEIHHRWVGHLREFACTPSRGSQASQATEHAPTRQPFIKGPLPMPWLRAAAALPGKTLHVGLYLWYLAGLTQSQTVSLSARVSELGVSREAKSEALLRLEAAGLVRVLRRPGCAPMVTLLQD